MKNLALLLFCIVLALAALAIAPAAIDAYHFLGEVVEPVNRTGGGGSNPIIIRLETPPTRDDKNEPTTTPLPMPTAVPTPDWFPTATSQPQPTATAAPVVVAPVATKAICEAAAAAGRRAPRSCAPNAPTVTPLPGVGR